MFTAIKERRAAAQDWAEKAAAAVPGEVWTSTYKTHRAVYGGRFASYIAGPVRILGDECPVPAFRGEKTLGECTLALGTCTLAPAKVPFWAWLFRRSDADTLAEGDTAPQVAPGTAADLLAVPPGRMVTVEHRDNHPVYAGLRFVDIGRAGAVTAFDDDEGAGRYVGDTWVRLTNVTGVQS